MKRFGHQHPVLLTAADLLSRSSRGYLVKLSASLLLVFSAGYILGSVSSPKPDLILQFPVQTHNSALPPPESVPAPPAADLLRFRTQCAPPLPSSQILPTVLEIIYNGSSPYDGFPDESTSSALHPPARRPRGWGSTNPVFADLVSAVKPLTIIELGTFLGASALHMASLTRALGLPTTILCLDDFRGWPGFRARFPRDVPPSRHGDALLLPQFMLAVAAAGEAARVLPIPFSTGSALAALCEWGVYGDLVEVDAGHDFHSAWADINMAWAVVRPGGVLFGHDYHTKYDDRGVRRAVDLFARVNALAVRPHGQHWVLSPKPLLL